MHKKYPMIRLDNNNNHLGIGFEFMTSTKLTGAHEASSGKKRNFSNHVVVVEQS